MDKEKSARLLTPQEAYEAGMVDMRRAWKESTRDEEAVELLALLYRQRIDRGELEPR